MAYPVGPLRQTTEGFDPMISRFFIGHHSDIIGGMRRVLPNIRQMRCFSTCNLCQRTDWELLRGHPEGE
ncbi:hypothetical protein D3C79_598030 [compost metagenome]